MTARTNSVKVRIVGEEYTIRSDESAEHTRAVAEHVDQAIRSIMGSGSVAETRKAAILAALQITDELFKERADSQALAQRIHDLSGHVRRMLPPAKRPSGEGSPR